jgi:hypothetical protein
MTQLQRLLRTRVRGMTRSSRPVASPRDPKLPMPELNRPDVIARIRAGQHVWMAAWILSTLAC